MSWEPEAIGRYRVVRRLGEGGFATVYLAEDLRLDAEVAIKILHPRMAADADIRGRFIREAQIMRRLATPGLVTVHDIDEFDDRPFFVMEYCTGGTLADRLEAVGGRIGFDEALALADALQVATAGIHQAGMVHRDLKPTNYLIRRRPSQQGLAVGRLLRADEELVVGDFGLAKAVDIDATQLTVGGGTPGYGSPEQFRGDPTVDARADVYSLSAILVSALSGTRPQLVLVPGAMPFDEATVAATGPLAGELARGLSFEREFRHRDVIEWQAAVAAAGRGAGGPGSGGQQAVAEVAGDPGIGPDTGGGWSQPPSDAGWPPPSFDDGPHLEPVSGQPWAQPQSGSEGWGPTRLVEGQVPPDVGGQGPSQPGLTGTGPVRPGRPGWLLPVVGIAVALVVLAGLGARFLLGGGTDSAIIGPEEGSVGDEVAFALDGTTEATWTVNGGDPSVGPVVSFTPDAPGRYRVEVEVDGEVDGGVDGGVERLDYSAIESSSALRIEGPALAPVGAETTLRAVGQDGRVTWTIAGSTSSGDTAVLRPLASGTVTVEVRVDGGPPVRRTITAVEMAG